MRLKVSFLQRVLFLAGSVVILVGPSLARAKEPAVVYPPLAEQVTVAVLAAPVDARKGATVLVYDRSGQLKTGRQGDNELICLADDPAKPGLHVVCYHRDLEPYMARGRQLRASGVTGHESRTTRWKEIDEGKLVMPKAARVLYVLDGDGFDSATKTVENAYQRWVIFTPYATAESTGLSEAPAPSAPWIMFPGTAGAHIMINPPKTK